MNKKTRVHQGYCQLCNQFESLTFEHVPPKAAFNDHLVYMQGHEELVEEKSFRYGKHKRSHRGFGGYTLCAQCNNNTGDWYAPAFVSFAKQGMEHFKEFDIPQDKFEAEYILKPLNVLKQILTMFMSADKGKQLSSEKELVDFLLNKESSSLPSKFKVYLYTTLSKHKRMIGPCVVYDPELGIQKWSEINFQPFGYLLADDSFPAHPDMVDISSFSNYKYNQRAVIALVLPYLHIETPQIGFYG